MDEKIKATCHEAVKVKDETRERLTGERNGAQIRAARLRLRSFTTSQPYPEKAKTPSAPNRCSRGGAQRPIFMKNRALFSFRDPKMGRIF